MNTRGLAFDAAPALMLVLRSFLVAPWFLAAAGAVLMAAGPSAWDDRYTPGILAATHLVTIGFVMLTATAAIFQLVPVVAGAALPYAAQVAPIVRWGFALGAIALAAAFLDGRPLLFGLAAAPLALAAGAFTLSAAGALWRLPKQKTTTPMGYAVAMLGIALTFGLAMAAERAAGAPASATLIWAHPLWVLTGGIFVLWAAVAAQVLPMFQATRPWPARLSLGIGPLVFGLLLAALAAQVWARGTPEEAIEAGLGALVAAYAAFIGHRLWTRGRRRADAMTAFWYLGLASLMAAGVIGGLLAIGVLAGPRWPLAFGFLAIMGAAVSLMDGMLYKIVPFLVWLHLQRRPGHAPVLMSSAIGERAMKGHAALHLATVGLGLAAIASPRMFWGAAAASWVADGALLGVNLAAAQVFYRRASRAAGGIPHATF